jgi:hypothetical protein
MKRLFLTIALAVLSVFGLMAEEKTKIYEFGDITRIESGFLYQIHITEGTSGKVTIVYESDYEKHLRVKYGESESKLRLALNEIPNRFKRGNQPVIHVYLEMDRIDEIMTTGGGAGIFFDGDFTGENVRVAAGVAATISDLKLQCRNLDLTCSGASRASVSGTVANSLDIEFSGASSGNMNISAQKLECNLSGACSLTNDGDIAKCEIECSGASKFINNGNIEDGNVECSGASAVKLTGKGSRLDLEGSGACKINTRDFIASDVILELSGASTASVYAEKSLKYSVSRTSKLTYYGNAEPIDMYESGNVVKGN